MSEGYRSKTQLIADLDYLISSHPGVAQKVSVGNTTQGNPILMYLIGNLSSPSIILSDAGMHGSEYGSSELHYEIIDWLLNSGEALARTLMDGYQFWFVVCLNYDKYNAMKEFQPTNPDSGGHGSCPYSAQGGSPTQCDNGRYTFNYVDLNRNFPAGFTMAPDHGASPLHDRYGNPVPEAIAMYNLFTGGSGLPKPKAYINLHCGSWFLHYYSGATDPAYAKVLGSASVVNSARAIAAQRGVSIGYGLGAQGSNGHSFGEAYAQGIQSWIFEFTKQWTDWDSSKQIYPTPPLVSYFKPNYFPPALCVFASVALSLPPAPPPYPPKKYVFAQWEDGTTLPERRITI